MVFKNQPCWPSFYASGKIIADILKREGQIDASAAHRSHVRCDLCERPCRPVQGHGNEPAFSALRPRVAECCSDLLHAGGMAVRHLDADSARELAQRVGASSWAAHTLICSAYLIHDCAHHCHFFDHVGQ